MSELKSLSNGQIVPLLATDEVGDAGDVLTRVGAGAEFKPPSGGGGTAWGDITGTLGDQTDLQAALDAVAPILHQATVELTDAQIKALPTSGGVQLVAAPGANKTLVPIAMVLVTNFTAEYTNLGERGYLFGNNGLGIVRLVELLDTTSRRIATVGLSARPMIEEIADIFYFQRSYDSDINDDVLLVGQNDDGTGSPLGDFTGGNVANRMRVSVTYYTLNTLTGVFE